MSVVLEISAEQERFLREAWGAELDANAFEALVIEGYRSGRYGEAMVSKILGHKSRWETEEWLAKRHVPRNYMIEDLEADRNTLDRLFRKSA